jgi:hypothetical protein
MRHTLDGKPAATEVPVIPHRKLAASRQLERLVAPDAQRPA